MRGALIDATLPVVMRRTCVCPSCLFSAATKVLAMQVEVRAGEVSGSKSRFFSSHSTLCQFNLFASRTCSSACNLDADEARTEMRVDHTLERPQILIIKTEVQ